MKTNTTIKSLLVSALAFGALAPAKVIYSAAEFEMTTSYSSRYITAGENNDPDSSGFLFSGITAEFEPITLGVWYAQSLRGSAYNEINLFAEYSITWEDFLFYSGITYLTYPALEDNKSWEYHIGVEYALWPWLNLFAETYYDFDDVRGGHIELGVSSTLSETGFDERLEITPYAFYGIDYGYVSGPRRLRSNNIQLGVEAEFELQPGVTLFAGAHHSFRLSNLRDEDVGDVSWVEAGFSWRF